MKAAIVTFIRAYNYGAVLQCYALQKALRSIGVEADVLDYYPEYFEHQYKLHYIGKIRYFPYRPLKSWLKYIPMLWILDKRNHGFSRFIERNISLSKDQFHSASEMTHAKLDYSAYISGSDQVWSPYCANFDPVFFLDFEAAQSSRKYSYAASFGVRNIPEELFDEYLKRLKPFHSISVREPSGIPIVEGLLKVAPAVCCDPTLLLDRHHWDAMVSPKHRKKHPYILSYYVNPSGSLLPLVSRLKQILKMDAYSITSISSYEALVGTENKNLGIIHKGAASPQDFLGMVANADFVITDSFHGTVFSVLFHKDFRVLTKFPSGEINHRALNLLKDLGIESLALSSTNDNLAHVEIDWESVDKKLSSLRSQSLDYLRGLAISPN